MTDKEKLIALLTEWGVGFRESEGTDGGSDITLRADRDEKVNGYCDFYANFVFDAQGKFDCVGIYE